jgi:phenylpyruvate tautomerase PptA (4-oxalocrotonate tautomerase family)
VPHLQFEVSEPLAATTVDTLVEWATDRYATTMDTGTGHVAVTVRDDATLAMGRADPDAPVAVLNADVRAGRSATQRRDLAVAVVDYLHDHLGVPAANVYVVYTEHPGEDFHLAEGPLASWSNDEAEDGAV